MRYILHYTRSELKQLKKRSKSSNEADDELLYAMLALTGLYHVLNGRSGFGLYYKLKSEQKEKQ